ncbi:MULTISPECIES: GNAT family N-acetyltransferase [unclassified Leptolyngbya]|uniref:GNAT family N-acetyltransferase n=1 Tax=unclassified Leptolyngbya TaxID=2650499 RepID=UPI001686606C|nr:MULTISPECIES: GNAT family N-acetyltransferase [unclassified Leptolyngbya]MBD1911955.1 N-acetyltransferase [Leptolyngbya sp. FACHB-8]MBD2158467.1 N-acetyltransferase [Leptolyngbya sp. FACHB-16]
MHRPRTRYTARWIHQVSEIPKAEWDALAVPLPTPFFEWEWLHNLEASGSATAKAGWLPNHLTLWRDRSLIAIAPFYIKGHSYGEFVFDHQWAELAQRLGIQYYPKLLGMSPFTPAEGYRFLIAPGEDEDAIVEQLINEIDHFCGQNKISGCNLLYVDPTWQPVLERHGFSAWMHHSFIWQNQGFQTFDDYLGSFNANQRRNIKRERKAVSSAGLSLKPITGDAISKTLCTQMYAFYSDTCDKFGWWGSKYLTRRFFEELPNSFHHRTVLFAAYEEDESHPVGMSLCFTKGDRLYGRYWGSLQDIENLHFDACYYSPIEWAIAHNIKIFDPGAGGRHKKRRGFPATPNYSLHRFYDQRLMHILRSYIDQINEQEQLEIDAINDDLPLKQLG